MRLSEKIVFKKKSVNFFPTSLKMFLLKVVTCIEKIISLDPYGRIDFFLSNMLLCSISDVLEFFKRSGISIDRDINRFMHFLLFFWKKIENNFVNGRFADI
jgi:hypothetical protein